MFKWYFPSVTKSFVVLGHTMCLQMLMTFLSWFFGLNVRPCTAYTLDFWCSDTVNIFYCIKNEVRRQTFHLKNHLKSVTIIWQDTTISPLLAKISVWTLFLVIYTGWLYRFDSINYTVYNVVFNDSVDRYKNVLYN